MYNFAFIMVSLLYTVSDLVFALVLGIILHETCKAKGQFTKLNKAFVALISWVLFFCLQDAVWGLCASKLMTSGTPLFFASSVFHLSTVLTTFFWLNYILTFLEGRTRFRRLYLILDGLIIALQVFLVAWNLFEPVIFRVVDGDYVTAPWRLVCFLNQYLVYVAISVLTGYSALRVKGERREKFISVFFFSLAPVLSGAFQFLYPDGPFYSMGYFLGCFIIHIYVVSKNRDELLQLQAEKDMAVERRRSITDALTGLGNRRSYEELMARYPDCPDMPDLTYMVADINGLKALNDTEGHEAGDELIRAAADCMTRSFGHYGTLYRLGGDEFSAVLSVREDELPALLSSFDDELACCKLKTQTGVSMSYGVVVKQQVGDISFRDLAKLADQRMYAAKEAYYSRKGFDRRSMQSAFTALCATYNKILKINITNDTFKIIQMNADEQTIERGYSDTISSWLRNFGTTGQVHEDDLPTYLKKVDLQYLRNFFDNEKVSLDVLYRRRKGDVFRLTKMEMIAAEDFTKDNKSLYLYVKDIDPQSSDM